MNRRVSTGPIVPQQQCDTLAKGKLVRVLPQWRPERSGRGIRYFVYAGRQ